MSVWFAIPSKRPRAEADAVLAKWRALGYRVAVFRDPGDEPLSEVDAVLSMPYPGYARAVNALCASVLLLDEGAEWIVTGGDDIEPDPHNPAGEIAAQCSKHFSGTCGVMQPTGDPWVDYSIERICGSPWMGRKFCERANGGRGPLWHEYAHMFCDEELQHVAIKLGILWQRRDLIQVHNHWMRQGAEGIDRFKRPPAFLAEANSPEHWDQYQTLFRVRQQRGFPGHELLAA